MTARITIGLPVFNGENYLEQTIRSILSQTSADLRLIIADNGSDDRTESICRTAESSDPRVRYERSTINRGAAWNYNRLVGLAQTEFFKWAAHDDLIEPRFVEACVAELDRSPAAVLAYPRTVLIGEHGAIVDAEFEDGLDLRQPDVIARFRSYLVHPGEQHPVFGVIRTECLRRTGLIANCWGGDQVLLAELLVQGCFHEVPERLFLRRYHPSTSLASRTPAEVARWYDPAKRGRTALPRTRLTRELIGVAMSAPLDRTTRLRCVASIATDWLPRFWRVIGGEIKRTGTAYLRT